MDVSGFPACVGAQAGAEGVAHLIAQAIRCAPNPAADHAGSTERLQALAARLAAARLQIAVVGQFKRGKSSLLNALLGEAVLPTGVLPLTAIPTFLAGGNPPRLRLEFLDGTNEEHVLADAAVLQSELSPLVTEAGNPANRRGLARVEVRLPAPLLSGGIVLLDTPGVGSTLRHNTAAAEAALPECDAALFVVSPDPPITQTELAYLAQVRGAVARLIIVLNKIDTVEREDRNSSIQFLRQVLTEQAGLSPDVPVFPLSARAALVAKQAHDMLALEASGLAAIEHFLADFIDTEAAAVLALAIAGKAAGIVEIMRMETAIELRALILPLEDLDRRIARFDAAVAGFHEERRAVADRIVGDRSRLFERIEQEAARLAGHARAVLERDLAAVLSNDDDLAAARQDLALRVPAFFGPALQEIADRLQEELSRVLARHQTNADALIGSVRQTAASLMDISFNVPEVTDAPELPRQAAWVTSGQIETLARLTGAPFERLLPAVIRRAHVRRRMMDEVATVTGRNVEGLRWSLRQSVDDACRRFAASLDRRFAATLAATRGTMEAARVRRDQQAPTVGGAVAACRATAGCLDRIGRALAEQALRSPTTAENQFGVTTRKGPGA